MITLSGYLGSLLLAICALPEAIRTYKDRFCHVGWGLLLTWSLGEILTFIYVLKTSKDSLLLFNYSVNMILLIYMISFKIRQIGDSDED